MLGMEVRMVRLDGSQTRSKTSWLREARRLVGSELLSDIPMREVAVMGEVDDTSGF